MDRIFTLARKMKKTILLLLISLFFHTSSAYELKSLELYVNVSGNHDLQYFFLHKKRHLNEHGIQLSIHSIDTETMSGKYPVNSVHFLDRIWNPKMKSNYTSLDDLYIDFLKKQRRIWLSLDTDEVGFRRMQRKDIVVLPSSNTLEDISFIHYFNDNMTYRYLIHTTHGKVGEYLKEMGHLSPHFLVQTITRPVQYTWFNNTFIRACNQTHFQCQTLE